MSQKTAFRGGLRGRTGTGVVPGPGRDPQYTVWGDKAGQWAGEDPLTKPGSSDEILEDLNFHLHFFTKTLEGKLYSN